VTFDFVGALAGLCDGDGQGTGFTTIDQPTNGTGYIPANLDVTGGELQITTTAGIQVGALNSLDNALAIGLSPPQIPVVVETEIVAPVSNGLTFAQAGVWFGNDEDNHVKLTVQSVGSGIQVELYEEAGGLKGEDETKSPSGLNAAERVGLRLTADPVNNTVAGEVSVNGMGWTHIDTFSVDGELFTADNATLPPGETRTFTGIMATHRNSGSPVLHRLARFEVRAEELEGSVETVFDKQLVTGDVINPTAMVLAADGKLYVTSVYGEIYRITFDPNTYQATQVVSFSSLNDFYGQDQRLALGLAEDPSSTAGNVILWLASAEDDGALTNGGIDVGSIVRISGSNLENVDEYVSGLPRAKENHSLNALHFAPDGRLFVAAGGATGAGQPPEGGIGLFGNRWEQPLSAALIAFDVNQPGWDPLTDGDCASGVRSQPNTEAPNPAPNFPNTIAELGASWTCQVDVYATGFRNMYDFAFHTNGEIYGADNGLGIQGTFPPHESPDCRFLADGVTVGYANPDPWDEGGDSPGEQPDLFHRIIEGEYYGHPNPSRGECIFMDGSLQGVAEAGNYRAPLYEFAVGRSVNGIVEYTHDSFCGVLQGDLIVSNFSSGSSVTRVELTADGSEVDTVFEHIVTGLQNPLPLVMGPDGVMFVGEFDQMNFGTGGEITALVPQAVPCS
jgi:glucose/arabinose dehydrogenase